MDRLRHIIFGYTGLELNEYIFESNKKIYFCESIEKCPHLLETISLAKANGLVRLWNTVMGVQRGYYKARK